MCHLFHHQDRIPLVQFLSFALIAFGIASVSAQTLQDLPGILIRANTNFVAGRYSEAAGDYEKVIGLNPESVAAHNNLGICYGRLEKYDASVKEFRAAIGLSPTKAELHLNLGIAYLMAKKNEDA